MVEEVFANSARTELVAFWASIGSFLSFRSNAAGRSLMIKKMLVDR